MFVFSILSPSASASSSRAQRGKETDGSISTRFAADGSHVFSVLQQQKHQRLYRPGGCERPDENRLGENDTKA